MSSHQYRLQRNYQFSNAKRCLVYEGATGWVVNRVGAPQGLYGVVRYTVDGDCVAWLESEGHCYTEDKAERWITAKIMEIKASHKAAKDAALSSLFVEALTNKAVHHKQWYLWKIAEELGIDLSGQWSDELPEPEKGTAP